ncbi:hypothetical protein [Halocatena marina]|uniref:Uncharacterized protein n=1 Tax=Halocatena marina TaxID=2934937 RepID=A0ABD5YW91_9EURY|nr:hypothetical protein [Halocatena marina]
MVSNSFDRKFGTRTRLVGAGHLFAAGIVHAGSAIWILTSYRPGVAMDLLTKYLISKTNETAVLEAGQWLGVLSSETVVAVAGCFLLLAFIQFVTALAIRDGKRWWWCLCGTLAGISTIISFPLVFVSATLIYLSRDTFKSYSQA